MGRIILLVLLLGLPMMAHAVPYDLYVDPLFRGAL